MKLIIFRPIGIVILLASIASYSCSFDPIDKKYNKHTAEDDYRRIKEISSIDSSEAVLLGKFMVEHGLVGPQVLELHASYKDILLEARKEKERYEIEKKKKGKNEIDIARSHEFDKIKKLKKVLSVDFVKNDETEDQDTDIEVKSKSKKTTSTTDKNTITYEVMFKNISEKGIKGFKGEINFYDLFHSEIKKTNFTSFQEIAPGESIIQKFSIDLDAINTETTTFKSIQKEHIKVEWLPSRLIHTDDEVIE